MFVVVNILTGFRNATLDYSFQFSFLIMHFFVNKLMNRKFCHYLNVWKKNAVRKLNWLRHFRCSNIVVYTETLVFPLPMNVSPSKAMTACNKRQNDCQKGQPFLFGTFWFLFCTFWFCRCSTHYNVFCQLCGLNFKALNVFLQSILCQFS